MGLGRTKLHSDPWGKLENSDPAETYTRYKPLALNTCFANSRHNYSAEALVGNGLAHQPLRCISRQ